MDEEKAWLMVAVYLVVQVRNPHVVLGAFISPLAFVFTLSPYVTYFGVQDFSGRLHSAWRLAHVAPTFLGYAILAVAFGCACFALCERHFLHPRIRIKQAMW